MLAIDCFPMEHLNQYFKINDLEYLSGIKAHTIRSWEKRFLILFPKRTKTNIRIYDVQDLLKIMNISLLNDYGYKISRIAKLSEEEIAKMVQQSIVNESSRSKSRVMNTFIVALYNLDQTLIHRTCEDLSKTRTFSQIINDIFVPLLDKIRNLREKKLINTVHEHFFVGLIKEKLYLKIALLEKKQVTSNKELYILFQLKITNWGYFSSIMN